MAKKTATAQLNVERLTMRTQKWFKLLLGKYKNDPNFLKEKIALLEDEIKFLEDKVEQLNAPQPNNTADKSPLCDCEYFGRCKDDPQKADYCPLRR